MDRISDAFPWQFCRSPRYVSSSSLKILGLACNWAGNYIARSYLATVGLTTASLVPYRLVTLEETGSNKRDAAHGSGLGGGTWARVCAA